MTVNTKEIVLHTHSKLHSSLNNGVYRDRKNGNIVINPNRGLINSNHSSNKSQHRHKDYRIKSGEKSVSNFQKSSIQHPLSPSKPYANREQVPRPADPRPSYGQSIKPYDQKYDKYKLPDRYEDTRINKMKVSDVANPLLFEMKRKEEYRNSESHNNSTISRTKP